MIIKYTTPPVLLVDSVESLLIPFSGVINKSDEKKDNPKTFVGCIQGCYVDICAAKRAGISMEEVFESITHVYKNSSIIYSLLYNQNCDEYRFLVDECGYDINSILQNNLLFLDVPLIHPNFDEQFLNLAVIHRTIQQWAQGCRLVVLSIHRFEFSEDGFPPLPGLMEDPSDLNEDEKLLVFYFGRLGFRLIPDTHLMVLDSFNERIALENIDFHVANIH